MATIDKHGALHAGDGKYTNKPQSAAGFDLDAGGTGVPEIPVVTRRFGELFDRPEFDLDEYRRNCEVFLNGRTDEERAALSEYVHSGYAAINSALYTGEPLNDETATLVRALDSALAAAPDEERVLWRSLGGPELNAVFLSQRHEVGDVVHFHGYSSASQTPDALTNMFSDKDHYMADTPDDQWQKDPDRPFLVKPTDEYTQGPARNAIFCIRTRDAAPVSTLRGEMVFEQEWLVPRDRKFRIAAIHRSVDLSELRHVHDGTRAQVFELEEV